MPKFKRELVPGAYLTAADMLHTLSQQQLVAAAMESTIVLAAEPAVAWLLDRCCVGKPVNTAAGGSNGTSHSSTCSDSSGVGSLAAAVATAGINRSSEEVQQQFEQHQAQVLARTQRRARRTPGYVATAGITAPAATSGQPSPAAGSVTAQGLGVQQAAGAAGTAGAADAAAGVESVEAVECAHRVFDGLHAASSSGAGCHLSVGVDELGQLQLVQLSFQEAFFLAHVLHCCSVFAVQQGLLADDQQPAQQGESGPLHAPQQQEQQQQQQQQQEHKAHGPLLTAELWLWCCSNTPGDALAFVSQYAAYKHFRCKGWLPLPGLLYGADYVLYKLHPAWAHSDFLVLVMVQQPSQAVAAAVDVAAAATAGDDAAGQQQQQQQQQQVKGGSSSVSLQLQEQQAGQPTCLQGSAGSSRLCAVDSSAEEVGSGSTQLTWLDAHVMQRLARQVLKQLLLLYVVVPPGLQLGSVVCMQQLTVQEVLLQRWVPSEHREGGKA